MAGSGIFSAAVAKIAHLVKGHGISAEVKDLRDDVAEALAPLCCLTVEEFTNPPAADTDAFKTSIATSTSAASYSTTALNGAVGTAALTYPRNVTVTASDSAASYQGAVTFTGTDVDGATITEAVTISNNATAVGAKMFKKVTKIDVVAQVDTSGALQFGFGALLGLAKKPKLRAGIGKPMYEIAVGAVVTTGTLSATDKSFTPAAAPDGSKDWAIIYEVDLS